MKIIGETKEGYILDASKDEIANLTGYWSEYQQRSEQMRTPVPGDTIQVHKMYKRLTALASKRKAIQTAQVMLREAADELELVDPIIAAADAPPGE